MKATGGLSDDFRYLLKLGPTADQILLADIRQRQVKDVATFQHDPRPGLSGVDAYSGAASTDGKTIVWMRHTSGLSGGQFYVVRPITGEVELLYETSDSTSPPLVSPDGTSIALLLARAGGIYVISLAERTIRRVFATTNVSFGALSWSADARWLAIALGMPGPATAVALVDVCGPEVRFDVGTRTVAAGRAQIVPDVFHASRTFPRRSFLLYGWVPESPATKVVEVEPATGATRTVYQAPPDIGLKLVSWSPSRADDFLTVEFTYGPANRGNAVWIRTTSGLQTRIHAEALGIGDAWWSPDGVYVYALAFSGNNALVIDAAHNDTIATFCFRDPCP